MAEVTVKQLAEEVGIPVDRLLTQLGEAGIEADTADTAISDTDKLQLLQYLRSARDRTASAAAAGGDPARRISLRRKSTSEIKLSGTGRSRSRTVSIEVRKRRTYVRRNEEDEGQPPATAAPVSEEPNEIASTAALDSAVDHDSVTEQVEQAAPALNETAPAEVEEAPLPTESPQEEQAEEPGKDESVAEDNVEAVESGATETADEPSAPPQAEESAPTPDEDEAPPAQLKDEPSVEEPKSDRASKTEQRPPRSGGKPRPVESEDASPVDEGRLEMQATRRRAQENLRRASAKRHQNVDREELEQSKRQELHVAKGKSGRRKKKTKAPARGAIQTDSRHRFEKPTAPVVRVVEIPETINVGDLAQRMAVKAPELIKQLMKMGVMATINQTLDQETAVLIVEEMGHKPQPIKEDSIEEEVLEQSLAESENAEWAPRPPVVTVMGHVDHGKTSLLDYIRESRVAAGESGGITQHIGAYHVKTPGGLITFLDTPGHAAFTRMRARGAGITDIVVLIVAADDGVMPQTREAIDHARAAEVPIVVALTKIDREEADPDRVKNELAKLEIIPEEWGGDIQFVGVSSVTGEGVEQLLESLSLQAEIMELKAPVNTPARGVVIESSLEKGRGPVATVLVKSGTLRQGDVVLSGRYFGRVRAMFDELGKNVNTVGASLPAEVLGLSGTPDAGDEIVAVADERKAREIAGMRESRERETKLAQQQATRLEEVFSQMESGETLALNLMVKADVHGSVEALAEALQDLSGEQIKIKIVARGVGGISESDVELAAASDAIMIGFNVRADSKAKRRIQETGVDVRYYSVIYNVINDIKDAATGMLGTEMREQIVGTAEVRDVFKSSRLGAIAGCLVIEGSVRRGLPIRVLRDNVVIYEGELESLRRFKDDVDKVEAGTECGIGVKNYNDVRAGDHIENFDRIEVKRTL